MTIARAQRIVLERMKAGSGALLAILLALPERPSWADGVDSEGRAVLLVGGHALRSQPSGEEAVTAVLEALAAGEVLEGVTAIAAAPKAAEGFQEIVEDRGAEEVLLHGPRGTGKTIIEATAMAGLAELHARAGYTLPLRVLWAHASMVDASAKTGRTLEEPLWQGLWTLRDDRKVAVLTVGGTEYVVADFVPTQDPTAAERLRAAAHVAAFEELIATLTETGGIGEREYEVALSSTAGRLPTRRRVAMSTTNPGAPDTWPYKRFVEGGGRVGCVAVQIPASDRLTHQEQEALGATFTGSPDLRQRLALGEWAELVLGASVTPGFTDAHIAKQRLRPVRNVALTFGHDGGHTLVTIIGARYQGSVQVYASLASEHAGTRQHLQSLVLPWLREHAPWVLQNRATLIGNYYDPSMETGEQADIDSDPCRVIRELLGGRMWPGAVSWPGRIEPVTALLGQFNTFTGTPTWQIDAIDGALLIRSLRGRWFYPTITGKVSRDLPKKPNHPFEDAGDSFAYFVGGIAPIREPKPKNWKPAPARVRFSVWDQARGTR